MASRAVKQPRSGLYAVFSSIVDDFILYDATREEVWTYFRDEAGTRRADEAVNNADLDKNQDGSTGRFDDCIDTIRIIHGDAHADEIRRTVI